MSQATATGRPAEPEQLGWFHSLPAADAHGLLLACCAAEPWASRLIAGRPYPTVTALLLESDEAVASLTVPQLADALAGHPRIGERVPAGRPPAASSSAGWSRREREELAEAAPRSRLQRPAPPVTARPPR